MKTRLNIEALKFVSAKSAEGPVAFLTKKGLLAAILLFMCMSSLFAQDNRSEQRLAHLKPVAPYQNVDSNTVQPAQTKKPALATLYICPICFYTCPNPAEPFTCPNDHSTLIGQGHYYCPKCFTESDAAGNCAHCGTKLILMEPPKKVQTNTNTQ